MTTQSLPLEDFAKRLVRPRADKTDDMRPFFQLGHVTEALQPCAAILAFCCFHDSVQERRQDLVALPLPIPYTLGEYVGKRPRILRLVGMSISGDRSHR